MSLIIVKDATGDSFEFDSILRESYQPTVRVTSHPIEDGSAVTDHAQGESLSFTITALMSASPNVAGGARSTIAPGRLDRTVAFLDSCVAQVLTVTTLRGTFGNCLITRYPHEVDKVDRLVFPIGFKQVEFAEAGLVDIPPDAPASDASAEASSPQDVNEQPTEDTSDKNAEKYASDKNAEKDADGNVEDTPAEEDDKSTLADIIDFFG